MCRYRPGCLQTADDAGNSDCAQCEVSKLPLRIVKSRTLTITNLFLRIDGSDRLPEWAWSDNGFKLAQDFAEILPRFISKCISHKAHKRIFSDRDPSFYWLYALGRASAGSSLGFIIPRSDPLSQRRGWASEIPSGQYVAKNNCTGCICVVGNGKELENPNIPSVAATFEKANTYVLPVIQFATRSASQKLRITSWRTTSVLEG